MRGNLTSGKWNFIGALCAWLALAALAVPRVSAQVSTATMSGTVTDASGATVAGAKVEVKNTGTGLSQPVTTDGQGRFHVPDLQVGSYEVQASMQGFQTAIHKGITLTVGTTSVVDFALPVGQSQQTITVEGEVSQVDTSSAALANLVEPTQMRELPLNGRNFQQLILLAPGTNLAQQSVNAFYGKGDTYSIAGGRPEGQAFLLDGTDVANFWTHGTGSNVLGTSLGIDAIGEFQTLTNTYGAQFGGNGSVINAVSKSGSNAFHGSGFEFLRNSALDTRNVFDKTASPPEYRRNQFGGTFSGPLVKDRAFFFVNYEGVRLAQAFPNIAFVPDANGRQGIIGGQHIQISSVVQPFLSLYPATSVVNPNGSGIATIPQVSTQIGNENYFLGRFDYTLSRKDSLFARYVLDKGDLYNPFPLSPIPSWPDLEPARNHFATVEERHIFSPQVINAARISFVRTVNSSRTQASNPLLQFTPGIGRQDGVITIAGLSQVGAQPLEPYDVVQNKFTEADEVSWIKGAHTIKFGGSISRVQTAEFQPFQGSGSFRFNSLSDFLQNKPALYAGAPPSSGLDAQRAWREIFVSPYINDDWRVNSRLTVNLGLRYDFDTNPKTAMDNLFVITNPPTNGVPPYSTSFTKVQNVWKNNPSVHNWGPRFGFAFDPFNDHKTSIRGGFGIFKNVIQARTWSAGFVTGPPFVSVSTATPIFPTPFAGQLNPPLPAQGPSPSYLISTTPYLMEWNLNIQREVMQGTILTVGFVGSRGVHLMQRHDVNPPSASIDAQGVYHFASPRIDPSFSTLNNLTADGNSFYNSLQVNAVRRLTHNVQAQVAYTYSKCLDYGSGSTGLETGGAPQGNPYDRRVDRGPCTFDITQALSANGIVVLPFKGNRFVEGYQLSGILRATTGPPLSVNPGFDRALLLNGTSFDNVRPNLNPGFTAGDIVTGNPTQWFNPAAFSLQQAGTLGNLGRNRLRNPGLVNMDFSVAKDTRITEKLSLQIRAEVFNIFNHSNFSPLLVGNAGAFISSGAFNPTAGVLTSTSTSSRQIQFAAKVSF